MNLNDEIGYDRVRKNSPAWINRKVNREIQERIREYAGSDQAAIVDRLKELDREWDVERVLELNAATLALAGIALAATHDKRWLILSGAVLSFFIQHAIQGWCPPLPILRRLGVRTQKEIQAERHGLIYADIQR